jgi:hypothetical protein
MRATWKTLATSPPRGFLPRSGGTALPLPTADGFVLVGGYTEEAGPAAAPPLRAPTAEAWTVRLGGEVTRLSTATGRPAPPPRLAAAGATVGGTAWLIGGWDPGDKGDGGEILGDVWSLDLASSAWTPHPAAALAAPASRHAAAPLPDGRVIIHTHRCGETVLCLDVADPGKPKMSEMACAPDPVAGFPSSRGLASLVALPPQQGSSDTTTTLLLFGGAPRRGGMDNDLWRLTVGRRGGRVAGQWARVGPAVTPSGGPPPPAWPPPRCSHVAAGLPGGMLVWSGSFYAEGGGLVARDDGPWWWDEASGAWSELPAGSGSDAPPAPRNAAAAAAVVEKGTGRRGVLVQGGWDPFRVTYGDTAVLWVE